MTLAIRIGASTQTYDNLATANSMRGNQKLAITGTGAEIYSSLATMVANSNLIANGIGSIKATDDIVVTAAEVTTYKAALIKLGTRSIVLDTATANTDVATNFNELDAVYTKIKSLRLAAAPTIAVEKLATAVNFAGLETLSGQVFNVSGTAATIKANMTSLLKNISKIGTITIAAGSTVELTASQLSTLGDKLRKTDSTSVVVLKDTADNILTTGNLALINRLNNSNINTASNTITIASGNGAATDTTGVITVASSLLTPFTTGDAVTYTGPTVAAGATNGSGELTQGATVFIRKLSSTTFALYNNYANAVNTASRSGIRNTATSTAMVGNLVSEGGNAPVRINTLNKVEVTKATLAQTNRLGELTAIIGSTAQGAANRLLSNIVSSVSITDTATNLMDSTNNATKTVTSIQNTAVSSATSGAITSTAHGFSTGDAVTYNMTNASGTAYSGIVSGTTYYVGKIGASADEFVLYDTRAKALAADLTSQATAFANAPGTGIYLAVNGTGTPSAVGDHTFTASTLDKAISKVGKFMDNTGTVSRVTIAGSGTISATTLDDIATKALRGNSAAQVTYSAKAVDVQNNLQALYDNQTTTAAKKLTEIVVTDGTSTGKKQIQMTQAFYTSLNAKFTRGVDQGGTTVNKNYAYNITNAAFDSANPTALQNDVNVSSYSVVGATNANLTGFAGGGAAGDYLRIALGQSKLKTLTSVSGLTSTERATISTLLNSIGSNTDRAKLKMIS